MSLKCYRDLNQIMTLQKAAEKDGRNLKPEDISVIENGAIVFDANKIHWVGKTQELPVEYKSISATSLKGHVLTPQITDSHTHLIFGGNRAFEYTMRLNGADYQDIANAGGGILATMASTKNLSFEEMYQLGKNRIDRLLSLGIGGIEIKSGYALTYESEKIISKVIHKLKKDYTNKVDIHNTYLAAHAVPKEYSSSKEYLDQLVIPLLEELAGDEIIDSVDIFHEQGYFTKEDTISLFEKAKELGIARRIHADEFNDNDGAKIATQYDCLSCDHLLQTSDKNIELLAKSNTVATLLPGTALFLGKPMAQARKFLDRGCKVAFASDYNPGSCHCDNLLLIASVSAKQLGINQTELWSGITLNSAHALGLKQQGSISEGMRPRFSIFKCDSLDEITYSWGKNLAVLI